MVARKLTISRHQLVTEIYTVDDGPPDGIDRVEETVHFLHGVRHEHRLEVVTILQTRTDTGRYGINILQDGSIFYAQDIRRGLGLDIAGSQYLRESTCLVEVCTAHGKIREPFHRHLLGVRRTSDDSEIIVRDTVSLVEILRADEVFVRYDSLDSRHDQFRI